MKLLFKRYTLISRLSPEELITRLKEQLGKHPHRGKIHDHSFKIERSTILDSDPVNVIKGDISATDMGSIVKLVMRAPIITFIIMVMIIAGCIYSSFEVYGSTIIFFIFLVPVTLYIAVFQIFKYHVKISKAFLLNLFEAEEVH
jgi:hypothetical protein